MNYIIAKFTYENKLYYIAVLNNNLVFYKMNNSNEKNYYLTTEETNMLKSIYAKLTINQNNSVYIKELEINQNIYSLFFDKKNSNYFWIPKNGIYNNEDNIQLNFMYNDTPSLIYSKNETNNTNDNKFYQKFIKVGKKVFIVLVAANLCSALLNFNVNNIEKKVDDIGIPTYTNSSIDYTEPTEYTLINEENNISVEFNYNEIESIINNNKNLSDEEKNFINKMKFVFEQNYTYMDIDLIKERLSSLKINYDKMQVNINGMYDASNNEITFNAESFENLNKCTFIHEFLHVLQNNSKNFIGELSNEFFARETLIYMYNNKLIDGYNLLNPVTKDLFNQNKLEAPKTDADMLYYIYWDNGFSSGYSQYISFYYAIANILPMETLREFEFNPAKIDIIADKLYEIEKNYNGNAQITNSYQLVDNINSIALNDNIQPITKIENSIKDIEYFYNNIKGYSIFDDLELLPYLNNMIYCIDLKTGNEKLLNSNNYLKDTYEYYGNVLPKSYFSKENSNPIYVYIENGEKKATIINDDIIENYVNYYNNLENSLNK